MKLYFVTSNKGKVDRAKRILRKFNIDLAPSEMLDEELARWRKYEEEHNHFYLLGQ